MEEWTDYSAGATCRPLLWLQSILETAWGTEDETDGDEKKMVDRQGSKDKENLMQLLQSCTRYNHGNTAVPRTLPPPRAI